ncbi:MAG: hypothetical protein FWE43_03385 [Streptococcaceae bacterium]|nr:hypothetical protein [Streptococcaceae bacterium]MCL2681507.1 hypothetical protein [Streptococcaceae bacterium]
MLNQKPKKYLVFNDTITADNQVYKMTNYDAYANKLGKLIGETDKGDQVFDLGESGYVAVLSHGTENIYENQNQNPINLLGEKIDSLETDNKITDSQVINEFVKAMSQPSVDAPQDVVMEHDLSVNIKSSKIGIYYQIMMDVDGNSYIFDQVSSRVYKIDKPLSKALGMDANMKM